MTLPGPSRIKIALLKDGYESPLAPVTMPFILTAQTIRCGAVPVMRRVAVTRLVHFMTEGHRSIAGE